MRIVCGAEVGSAFYSPVSILTEEATLDALDADARVRGYSLCSNNRADYSNRDDSDNPRSSPNPQDSLNVAASARKRGLLLHHQN